MRIFWCILVRIIVGAAALAAFGGFVALVSAALDNQTIRQALALGLLATIGLGFSWLVGVAFLGLSCPVPKRKKLPGTEEYYN